MYINICINMYIYTYIILYIYIYLLGIEETPILFIHAFYVFFHVIFSSRTPGESDDQMGPTKSQNPMGCSRNQCSLESQIQCLGHFCSIALEKIWKHEAYIISFGYSFGNRVIYQWVSFWKAYFFSHFVYAVCPKTITWQNLARNHGGSDPVPPPRIWV